ncbi:hypothetical protein [Chryseobacterium sp. BIGb0232]|uniref:hypothetical protein n=1 Tax=Chryseobacterium sp. BIGb0232 TaxID=2940598 RepID=UPI000F48D6A2|nr:hypothetical protein [Chryseobacterium sp. BIGb0232]MCS4303306.1 hypothetical protein [Chryseobacterium sp. BIGb0232]ROS11420.1 hypothetical protein EDF65_3832 [Chryseobacterium nakagawai]
MERVSNSIEALMNAAKAEIENFELRSEEKIIAYFSELPTIGGFPYKIILAEMPDGSILSKFRQWDTEYNLKQWTSGINNLDRLRVITDEKILSETDTAILKKELSKLEQIKLPESIRDQKAIILDGSEWKFGISLANKNRDYTWVASTEDINLFVPVIELIRKQYLDRIK